jgi:peptidoglycan/LPS O-acetylase OafA/YrhL
MQVSSTPRGLRGRIVSVIAATLIGVGLFVFARQLTGLSGPGLFFLSLGAGFFAAYASQRARWAMWPAAAFGGLAWLSLVASTPWLKETWGTVAHIFWPLVLVAGGLWLIERARRRHQIQG